MNEPRPTAKRPWRAPQVKSLAISTPSALLACSPGAPVDCFPLDGFHHCVQNACGCVNKPPHC